MKRVRIEVGGRDVEGWIASASGGTLWVHVEGEAFTFEPQKTQTRGKKPASADSLSEITAPMPGKIVKIQVRPGDKVIAGQQLLVMEAMKMEYTLKASAAGLVERLDCQAGEQVALGQLLVKLKL